MNQQKKKIDWLTIISIILVISSIFIFGIYYFESRINECTSDPMRFALEKIKSDSNADDVYGTLIILKDGQPHIKEFFLE